MWVSIQPHIYTQFSFSHKPNDKDVPRMIHTILIGPFHSLDLRVRVINDRSNETGRSRLTQSVLFHAVAKRNTPASSASAIPNPNPIFITENRWARVTPLGRLGAQMSINKLMSVIDVGVSK